MKSKIYSLKGFFLIVGCSTPRYAYHFDHYDYRSAKKTEKIANASEMQPADFDLDPTTLVASRSDAPVLAATSGEAKAATVAFRNLNRSERKMARREIKREIRNYVRSYKAGVTSTQQSHAMDNDLRLAAIFGAIGIVGLLISGNFFYIIGGIALIIGVVFFVKWLVRQ